MLAAPVAVAGPVPIVAAPGYVDPIIVDEAATFRPADIDDYPLIDYRFFRYSSFALPWLVWMLVWFIVLLGLTFWFGNYSIGEIGDFGVPRDLEIVPADNDVGGHPRPLHNLRFASGSVAMIIALLTLLIYYADVRAKITRILCLIFAVLLLVNSAVAWIAFAIDLGHLEDAEECQVVQGTTNVLSCRKNSGLAYTVTAFDGAVALLSILVAVELIIWKNACHRERTERALAERERALEDPAFADSHGMHITIPGQYHVYRVLIFLGLFVLFVAGALQIFFTIMIMQGRAVIRTGQQANAELYGQLRSGWDQENSRFRVATTTIGIILVFLSLVPYPHRVYAYIIGILFIIDAVMFFVQFAIDVNDLEDARDLPCPTVLNIHCDFEKYTTTCVFDFLCGIWIVIYVIVEFLIHKRRSYVAAREYIAADVIDDYDFGPGAFIGGPGNTLEERKLAPVDYRKPAGGLRPLLGVEVMEVDHPATGELSVSVVSVAQGGAAHEAGLVVGDVITRWNNMPIHTKADFAAAVRDSVIGSVVTLQVVRPQVAGFGSTVEYLRMVVRGVAL